MIDIGRIETKRVICEYLGCGWTKIRRLRRQHHLPVKKVGGRWMASTVELDEWKRRHPDEFD